MSVIKKMDHAAYMKKVRTMTYLELAYTWEDASGAAEAMPEGPNYDYYRDEAIYCSQEIRRRDLILEEAKKIHERGGK